MARRPSIITFFYHCHPQFRFWNKCTVTKLLRALLPPTPAPQTKDTECQIAGKTALEEVVNLEIAYCCWVGCGTKVAQQCPSNLTSSSCAWREIRSFWDKSLCLGSFKYWNNICNGLIQTIWFLKPALAFSARTWTVCPSYPSKCYYMYWNYFPWTLPHCFSCVFDVSGAALAKIHLKIYNHKMKSECWCCPSIMALFSYPGPS